MQQYEITFLTTEEAKNPGVDSPVAEIINGLSGKIISGSSLGQKQLVYKIKKMGEAYFSTIIFELPPEKITELTRKLNLKDEILRTLIVIHKKSETSLPKISEKKIEEKPFDKAQGKKEEVKEEKEVEGTKTETKAKTKVKLPKITKTLPAKPEKSAEPEIDEEARLKTLDEKLNELLKE